mgnify:CR=1 FL=1
MSDYNTYETTNVCTTIGTFAVLSGAGLAAAGPIALIYSGVMIASWFIGNIASEGHDGVSKWDIGGVIRQNEIVNHAAQSNNPQMTLISNTILSTAARTALRPVAHTMLALGVVADLVGYAVKPVHSIAPLLLRSDKYWNKIWKSGKSFTITHSLRKAFTKAHLINPHKWSAGDIERNRIKLNLKPKVKPNN